MYIKPLQIGDIELKNNLLLAPMAGITDKAFRIICKKYSDVGLVSTEMVSSKAIYHNDQKTLAILDREGEKGPVAIQIFGSEPDVMGEAVKKIESKADIIDINLGCPAPKVVKNGDGSRLLLNLPLAEKIIKSVVNATTKPVTVKIRKGWDDEHIVAVELAKIAEKSGAKLITIHGRTREEYYSGNVDLDIIKQVKENVDIPVIGNGDIKTIEDAKKMFEYTKVDGLMIGRGMIGTPWFIGNIIKELMGESQTEYNKEDKLKIMIEHLKLEIKNKGEYIGIREMRKHLCWYLKNLPNSSNIRQKVNQIEKEEQLVQELNEYFKTL